MNTTTLQRTPRLPSPTRATLTRALAMGVAGLAAWEIFARVIAPHWIGFALDPTGLIEAALGATGVLAHAIHIITGLMFFPLGYLFVARPLANRLVPALPWPLLGLGYGIALWVFAMYGMAHLLAGMPPFLDFEPIAWASLVGHLGLALALAAVAAFLSEK